jgi:hypothetical protein
MGKKIEKKVDKKETKKAAVPKAAQVMPDFEIKHVPLGTRMKDTVTGFEGIAVAKIEFLNGCVQYNLKPKLDKDGKIVEAQMFDSQQLIVVDDGLAKAKKKDEKPTGGDMPDAPYLP